MEISESILSKRALKYGNFEDQYGIYHNLMGSIRVEAKPDTKTNSFNLNEELSVAYLLRSLLVLKAQRIIVCRLDKDHLYDFLNYLKFAKNLNYYWFEFDERLFSKGLNDCKVENIDCLFSSPASIFSQRLVDIHAKFIAPRILDRFVNLVADYQVKQGIPTACDKDSFTTNLEGELAEFIDSFSPHKIDDATIDAICDSLVFICGFLISYKEPDNLANNLIMDEKLKGVIDEFCNKLALPILHDTFAKDAVYKLACGLIAVLEVYYSLDSIRAFTEVIKEISSRQGLYSSEVGRFQKLNNYIGYPYDYKAKYCIARKFTKIQGSML